MAVRKDQQLFLRGMKTALQWTRHRESGKRVYECMGRQTLDVCWFQVHRCSTDSTNDSKEAWLVLAVETMRG